MIRDHAIGHFISPWDLNPIYDWDRDAPPADPIFITREAFEAALIEAWDRDEYDLDYFISPKNSKGIRYYPHRREPCKRGKHACMMMTKRLYATVTSYRLPDGRRQRTWRSFDLTGIPKHKWSQTLPAEATYYTRTRDEWWHHEHICKNIIRLEERQQIRGVVHYIFGRRKRMQVYTNRKRWRSAHYRRDLLRKFYEHFIEEGILQADVSGD